MKRIIAIMVSMVFILSLFPVTNSIAEGETDIYVSAYQLYTQSPAKVTSNRIFSATQWGPKYLSLSGTGGYESGKYFTLEDTNAYVEITIDALKAGKYDVYTYIPGATLTASNHTTNCDISITGSSNNVLTGYNMSNKTFGAFNLLAENVEIKDTLVMRYTAKVAKPTMRVDTIKLVPKQITEPTTSPEPTSSTEPIPSTEPTTSPEPTDTPVGGTVTVENVKVDGQKVDSQGIEGYAVDGICNITYEYKSSSNVDEDKINTKIQWYKSLFKDGEYTPVIGATTAEYKVGADVGGYYLKAGVIGVDINGVESSEVFSVPMQVKYKLSFQDDFDYVATSGEDQTLLDHGWTSDKSIRVLGSPTIYCARVPENITVNDGKLKITTRKEHLDKYNSIDYEGKPHTWTSGQVFTTDAHGPFGVYDASYKLTKATGLNQSFWAMLRGQQTVTNKFVELDFNEGHYPYEMASNIHRSTGTGTVTAQNSIKHYPLGNTPGVSETLADNFNRYTGMLKPNNDNFTWDSTQNADTYQVYFNNSLQRKTRSLQYEPSPVSIFFSVAVYPGTFTGPLVDSDADGSVMEVDWVRYYEFLGTTKADLERQILKAQEYKDTAVIGNENGNYSEVSVDSLGVAISNAREILNSDYENDKFAAALTTLQNEVGIFLRSVVGGYYVHVESINFSEKNINMLIQKTKQLDLVISPNDANDKSITYSSSNTNVATVSDIGVVTAISSGNTIITAMSNDGGIQTQCAVTVSNLPDNQVFYQVTGGKLIFDKTSKTIVDYVGSPTEIVIPSRIDNVPVESIAINTFKNLTTLKTLIIKQGITSIGDWSFVGCTSLENIQLPNTLVSINTASFQDCDALKEIIIPPSVTNIEDGAFSLCDSLKKVVFKGNSPAEVGRVVFGENTDTSMYFYSEATGFDQPTWNGYNTSILEGSPIQVPIVYANLGDIINTNGRIEIEYTLKPKADNLIANTVFCLAFYENDILVKLVRNNIAVEGAEPVDGVMKYDATEYNDNGKIYNVKAMVWDDSLCPLGEYTQISNVEFKIKRLYNSLSDFTDEQGPIWKYQSTQDSKIFTDMQTCHFENKRWQGKYSYLQSGGGFMHPDKEIPVRTFVAPFSGDITIKQASIKATDAKGTTDGIFIKILKKNGEAINSIYPTDGTEYRSIFADEHLKGTTIPEIKLSVNKGDEIYFILYGGANVGHDGTIWSSEIEYTNLIN